MLPQYIVRQPILDREERVYGYDLHFRAGNEEAWALGPEVATDEQPSPATPLTDKITLLTGGTLAFVSLPREALLAGHEILLPADKRIVLAIPALSNPEPAILSACRKLKLDGYSLLLEDFPTKGDSPLVEFASLIKMDVTASPDRAQWMVIRKLGPKGIMFVADKVDTRTQFQSAMRQGYAYFQGQFFMRPHANGASELAPTKLVYLLVLGEVTRPEINMEEVASIIKHDLALSYKLLRFLNSARFAFPTQVTSIRHALLLLGENELRKWIGLISVSTMGEGGPPVLVTLALVRAAFCEALAPLVGEKGRQADYFFMGLLSSIDLLLRRPMRLIMADLPMAPDIGGALQGEKGRMRDVLDLVTTYEQGRWTEFSPLAKKLSIPEEAVANLHLKALLWSHELPNGKFGKSAGGAIPSNSQP